jgi:hypothetical protein
VGVAAGLPVISGDIADFTCNLNHVQHAIRVLQLLKSSN